MPIDKKQQGQRGQPLKRYTVQNTQQFVSGQYGALSRTAAAIAGSKLTYSAFRLWVDISLNANGHAVALWSVAKRLGICYNTYRDCVKEFRKFGNICGSTFVVVPPQWGVEEARISGGVPPLNRGISGGVPPELHTSHIQSIDANLDFEELALVIFEVKEKLYKKHGREYEPLDLSDWIKQTEELTQVEGFTVGKLLDMLEWLQTQNNQFYTDNLVFGLNKAGEVYHGEFSPGTLKRTWSNKTYKKVRGDADV